MVIFGSPGLVRLYDAYAVLHQKILECKKPIFPILPSVNTAGPEVQEFLKKGHVNFADEVTLATALTQVMKTPAPADQQVDIHGVDVPRIRRIIDSLKDSKDLKDPNDTKDSKDDGYLPPHVVRELLECAGIPTVPEFVSEVKEEVLDFADKCGYPVVAKVVGPVHKSDVGGVALNIRSREVLAAEFDRLMKIDGATSVMVQKMIKGTELLLGLSTRNASDMWSSADWAASLSKCSRMCRRVWHR